MLATLLREGLGFTDIIYINLAAVAADISTIVAVVVFKESNVCFKNNLTNGLDEFFFYKNLFSLQRIIISTYCVCLSD